MTRSLLVIAMAALVGCDDGSQGPIPPDQITVETSKATCKKLASCCTDEEFADEAFDAETEAECVQIYAAFADLVFDAVIQSIDAGRIIYHADRMGACIAAMEAVSCSEFAAGGEGDVAPRGCENPFEGTVADGAECATDFDCISTWCSGDMVDFEGQVTFGTCGPAPGIGQPCEDFECAPGAYCDTSGAESLCQMPKADGAECETEDECTSGGCNDDGTGVLTCGAPTTCNGR